MYAWGPQTPGHRPIPVCGLLRTELPSRRQASKATSVFAAAPQCQPHHLSSASDHQALDSRRRTSPWCPKSWEPLMYAKALKPHNSSVESALTTLHLEKLMQVCATQRGSITCLRSHSWEFMQPTPTYLSGLNSEEPSLTTQAGLANSPGSSGSLGFSHHNPDHSSQYSSLPPLSPMNSVLLSSSSSFPNFSTTH